jgi:hypothetical protein
MLGLAVVVTLRRQRSWLGSGMRQPGAAVAVPVSATLATPGQHTPFHGAARQLPAAAWG